MKRRLQSFSTVSNLLLITQRLTNAYAKISQAAMSGIFTVYHKKTLRANVCKNRATGGHGQKLNFTHILSIHTH